MFKKTNYLSLFRNCVQQEFCSDAVHIRDEHRSKIDDGRFWIREWRHVILPMIPFTWMKAVREC